LEIHGAAATPRPGRAWARCPARRRFRRPEAVSSRGGATSGARRGGGLWSPTRPGRGSPGKARGAPAVQGGGQVRGGKNVTRVFARMSTLTRRSRVLTVVHRRSGIKWRARRPENIGTMSGLDPRFVSATSVILALPLAVAGLIALILRR